MAWESVPKDESHDFSEEGENDHFAKRKQTVHCRKVEGTIESCWRGVLHCKARVSGHFCILTFLDLGFKFFHCSFCKTIENKIKNFMAENQKSFMEKILNYLTK